LSCHDGRREDGTYKVGAGDAGAQVVRRGDAVVLCRDVLCRDELLARRRERCRELERRAAYLSHFVGGAVCQVMICVGFVQRCRCNEMRWEQKGGRAGGYIPRREGESAQRQ
jgi:hypothetical protein